MNTTNESASTRRILIHRDGEQGGFEIETQGNGNTARIVTPHADMPEWALNEQLVSADMKERQDFYEKRIGAEGYAELIGKEEAIQFRDLKWDAVDNEGDIVTIEPNHSWRSENLADMLGLDPSVEAFDAMQADALIDTDKTQPTDEQTLAEAEGQNFGELQSVQG